MLTLAGKSAWLSLGAALLVGGASGAFLSGWKKARGVEPPAVEAAADAGVFVQVDAGVHVSQTLDFHLGDWVAVRIPSAPPPARPRASPDAGPAAAEVFAPPCPDSFVMLPTVNVTEKGTATAAAHISTAADATSAVKFAPAPAADLDRRWEVGGAYLHRLSGGDFGGPTAGVNFGPLGVRATALFGSGDVFVGGSLVWRFP